MFTKNVIENVINNIMDLIQIELLTIYRIVGTAAYDIIAVLLFIKIKLNVQP